MDRDTYNWPELGHRKSDQVASIPTRPDLRHLAVQLGLVLLDPGYCLLFVVEVRHLELASGDLARGGQGADNEVFQGCGLLCRVRDLDQLLGLLLAGAITAKSWNGGPVSGSSEDRGHTLSSTSFSMCDC